MAANAHVAIETLLNSGLFQADNVAASSEIAGGTGSGTFTVASGSELIFVGTYDFTATSSVDGDRNGPPRRRQRDQRQLYDRRHVRHHRDDAC